MPPLQPLSYQNLAMSTQYSSKVCWETFCGLITQGCFWCKFCKLAKMKTAMSFFIDNYNTMCSIHQVYHPQLNFWCHSLWINNTPLHLSAIYLCPASTMVPTPGRTVPLSPSCWLEPCTAELTMAHHAKLAVFWRIFCLDSVLRILNLCLKDTSAYQQSKMNLIKTCLCPLESKIHANSPVRLNSPQHWQNHFPLPFSWLIFQCLKYKNTCTHPPFLPALYLLSTCFLISLFHNNSFVSLYSTLFCIFLVTGQPLMNWVPTVKAPPF